MTGLRRGDFDGKVVTTRWEVAPGPAERALTGLTGNGGFGAPMGRDGTYTLTYEVTS